MTIAPDGKQVGFLMDIDLNVRKIGCQELFSLWLDSPDATRGTRGNLIEPLID